MKYIALILMLISGGVYAGDISSMKRFEKFTDNLDTVSASFQQIKMIPESDKKFISSGHVKFQKGRGFIWIQNAPTKQVAISTKTKYCVDGVSQDLNSLPYFSYIRRMIDDALSGDMSSLQMVFNIDYSEYDKNQWQITAKPRFDSVAEFVQDFVMYGTTDDLTKIILTYQNGTVVIIKFNRMNTEIKDEIAC
ncbi:MAG: outer membrane lipoprotein carrier protein LolA [Alphaproteobacteria bacterium]|nr:outer membrane lipoprotein carrier protein LolA [Alphaproteobacteria bacterium]